MHVSCELFSHSGENRIRTDPLVVTPSLVVARGLVHLGKSETRSAKGFLVGQSAGLLQLRPVWADTANTRKLGLAIHGIDSEIREVPLATLECGK